MPVSLVSLAEIRQQCRIPADDESGDLMLELYAGAAKKMIENKTGLCLFGTKDEFPVEKGWYQAIDEAPDLKLAILLLITHFFENPSATTDVSTRTLPFSVKDFISPYIVTDPSIPPD